MPAPPECVGTFEVENTICNGDPNGSTPEQQAPCAWRNRCAGLQAYCLESNAQPEVVVATLDYERLVGLCEAKVEQLGISKGIVGGPPEEAPVASGDVQPAGASPRVETPKPKAPKKRRRSAPQVRGRGPSGGTSKRRLPLAEDLLTLGAHFETSLRDLFPEREFATGKRMIVRPGIFYPVDRTKGSHYVSWYCTSRSGSDHALACLRFKPRLGKVHLGLPVKLEDLKAFLGARTFKRLNLSEHHAGQFFALANGLDAEGLALAAEVIKQLVEADLIPLPG